MTDQALTKADPSSLTPERRQRIRELMESKAVRDFVAKAPRFTERQRERLAALLNSTR